MRKIYWVTALCLGLSLTASGILPKRISYQGVLTDTEGNAVTDGSYSLTFRLYDSEAATSHLWEETQSVSVQQGLFHVILGDVDSLGLEFNQPLWMGIAIGGETEMTPRIELTASAYSIASLGTHGIANKFPSEGRVGIGTLSPQSTLEASGIIHSTSGGFKFPDGTVQTTASTGSAGSSWLTNGNTGTTAGTHFLGTLDDEALEFKVNSVRAFRIEPCAYTSNIIGGYSGNSVDAGVVGATISGGGSGDGGIAKNRVSGEYGTVGGGQFNIADTLAMVGGGSVNYAYGNRSVISGGYYNRTTHYCCTVGGGIQNEAVGALATIAGGGGNRAGYRAFVGGGEHNEATGIYSIVPGGNYTKARGSYSYAAGYYARANHRGSFVWADRSSSDTTYSTDQNQFIIRAAGGMGIGTNTPSEMLTVAGVIESTTGGFKFPDGTVQTSAYNPMAASGRPQDLSKMMETLELIPELMQTLQRQQRTIDALKAEIDALKKQ